MKQKRQYLIPELKVLELSMRDVLSASDIDRDPYDVDGFDPLGSGFVG